MSQLIRIVVRSTLIIKLTRRPCELISLVGNGSFTDDIRIRASINSGVKFSIVPIGMETLRMDSAFTSQSLEYHFLTLTLS